MASTAFIISLIVFGLALRSISCQRLITTMKNYEGPGICRGMYCNSLPSLERIKNCVVIVGNLNVVLLERSRPGDFNHTSFPNLREITGFLLVYRLRGLYSVGKLFPNLARIRGQELVGNYALIIYDMVNLKKIDLFSLVKIDRGGVIIWGGPQTCYIETVDWKAISPKSRHVLSPTSKHSHCSNMTCSCNPRRNFCWSENKCQRFLDGPRAEVCHEQCLGCTESNITCTLCRNYTYRGNCVTSCPPKTLILAENQYCLTSEECRNIGGFILKNNCVFDCPVNYKLVINKREKRCEACINCAQICDTKYISTIDNIQDMEKCVIINGSLVIYLRVVPEAMEELTKYLRRIEEVRDFIYIYGSQTITSLDFLSSLRLIRGKALRSERYSLVIHGMLNMQRLFMSNVTANLKINNGTLRIINNPKLCTSEIEKISKLFPSKPKAVDIPHGMNGYSGNCKEVFIDIKIHIKNETSAFVTFVPTSNSNLQYTVLYVRIPQSIKNVLVPEGCSQSEWVSIESKRVSEQNTSVELTSLKPSSTYAVCLEIYDPVLLNIARSAIVKFKTPVGKPAPPFISELVATSPHDVVLRWLDHEDYRMHITHYQLDVSIIEFSPGDSLKQNHCKITDFYHEDNDLTLHGVIMKPPPEYGNRCESMCGVLFKANSWSTLHESFDILSYDTCYKDCEYDEYEVDENSTISDFIRKMTLNVNGPRTHYKVVGLAPYRDYRFRLRSCIRNLCSRYSQNIVRTLISEAADVAEITSASSIERGKLRVDWRPPPIYNGAILAYFVEVADALIKENGTGYQSAQTWCVLSDESSIVIELEESVYSVRVCTYSLASKYSCNQWFTITQTNIQSISSWWYSGIVVGIILWTVSLIFSWVCKTPKSYIDEVPLIDSTSEYRSLTQSPSLSDITSFYIISFPNDNNE